MGFILLLGRVIAVTQSSELWDWCIFLWRTFCCDDVNLVQNIRYQTLSPQTHEFSALDKLERGYTLLQESISCIELIVSVNKMTQGPLKSLTYKIILDYISSAGWFIGRVLSSNLADRS